MDADQRAVPAASLDKHSHSELRTEAVLCVKAWVRVAVRLEYMEYEESLPSGGSQSCGKDTSQQVRRIYNSTRQHVPVTFGEIVFFLNLKCFVVK